MRFPDRERELQGGLGSVSLCLGCEGGGCVQCQERLSHAGADDDHIPFCTIERVHDRVSPVDVKDLMEMWKS